MPTRFNSDSGSGVIVEPFKILTFPDVFLQKPTRPVENIDGRLQGIIERMAHTMFQAPGVGLASIQVGCDESLIVYDAQPGDEKALLKVLINPRIVHAEGLVLSEQEGCLSVPDFRADVKRHKAVTVEGFDRHGKPVRIDAEDFMAIVLQHEIDHLSGTLFIDHISSLKRQLYRRKMEKRIKQYA